MHTGSGSKQLYRDRFSFFRRECECEHEFLSTSTDYLKLQNAFE